MHAERRGRLVEDQDAGAEIDRASDGDALALAARKGADRLAGVADADADLGHLLAGDAVGKAMIEAAEAARSRCTGSRPMKKLRAIDISGTVARS